MLVANFSGNLKSVISMHIYRKASATKRVDLGFKNIFQELRFCVLLLGVCSSVFIQFGRPPQVPQVHFTPVTCGNWSWRYYAGTQRSEGGLLFPLRHEFRHYFDTRQTSICLTGTNLSFHLQKKKHRSFEAKGSPACAWIIWLKVTKLLTSLVQKFYMAFREEPETTPELHRK